jgi:competence protein ComEC
MAIFTEHPAFSFFRKPFVLIFFFFSAGLLNGFILDRLQVFLTFLLVFLILLVITLLFFRKTNVYFMPFIMLGFFISGILLMQERRGLFEVNSFRECYHLDDMATVKIDGVAEGSSEWKKLTGTAIELRDKEGKIVVNERVVLFVQTKQQVVEKGDVVLVAAPFEEIANAGNPGEFDAAYFWRSKGIRHMAFVGSGQFSFLYQEEQGWIARSLDATRAALQQMLKTHMTGDELAIALALILGDKSLLDTEVKNSFINTGAMHILAVSGLHIGIIMQILIAFFGFFPRIFSKKGSILLVVALMWIYAVITGLSPSVLRAVFMFSILVLSQLTERNYDSINSLFFTGFVLCLINPFTLLDIGFQLSFLAMIGIFLLYKPIEQLLFFENRIFRKIWQGTAIGFAAQLMTTPLSLYYFHQFPNYFVLTNIGLMASSGIILGGGLLLFGLGWIRPLGMFIGWVLTKSVFLSLGFIRWVESLPGAVAYGFDLSLLTVLIAMVWVLVIFILKLKAYMHWIFLALGLVIVTSMVLVRHNHIKLREVCVLNMKFPLILVKTGEHIFCFHDADKEEWDKLHFAVDGYRKIYPGTVRYFSIKKRNWSVNGVDSICVESIKGGKTIVINGQRLFLLERNEVLNKPNNVRIIGMPWIRTPVDHSLNRGAFRCRID